MKSTLLQWITALIVFVGAFELSIHRDTSIRSRELIMNSMQDDRLEATYAMASMQWYNDQRAYPTGTIPLDWREKALAHTQAQNLKIGRAHV